ncbi:MAG TPA: MFS transporter [Vicinamibacterales bacterium]|nr:MFS transporter [Vicinamibacterales bacterium]
MTIAAGPPAPDSSQGTDTDRTWTERLAGALSHRNYRLLWFAALGSTIGTWMQSYAQSWLIFDLTKSNFYLGLDSFLGQLPILLLILIGGVIADRHDKRRLLTFSQYTQAFSALTLALLVFTGHINIWMIFLLSIVAGTGQAFGGPAYQALIPSLVPRRDMQNAIALNSTQFNLSRVLGPVAGGAVLAGIGVAWCFTLNGVSFFLVVVALASLHLPPHVPNANPRALGHELRGGLTYVRENRLLVLLTLMAFITTFLAMPVSTFLPAFATTLLTGHQLPETRLWMLMAAQGLGAIVGALVIGTAGRFKHMGRALLVGQISLALFVTAFAASRWLPLSLLLVFFAGMCSMAVFSMSFSLVQLTVPDALRGRVVSIYMVALRGGWPLGALVAGALSDKFTVPVVITANCAVLVLIAGTLLLRKHGTLHRV